jgi:RNA polymerase sigma factor (TIGR02999 family)
MSEVTQILSAIEQGDTRAADQLFPLIYEALRELAAAKLVHEAPGQTLQATALVHEAYLKLVETKAQHWNSRGHFFAAAAEAMRRILVDQARRKYSLKRGGDRVREPLDEAKVMAPKWARTSSRWTRRWTVLPPGTRKRRNWSSCVFLADSPRPRQRKP